jgi:hypothetical protein
VSVNTPALPIAGFHPGLSHSGMFLEATFRLFHPGQNPARATPTPVPRQSVASRCAASAGWTVALGRNGRRTSPKTTPRSTRAGARPARQYHRAPPSTGRNPLSGLALHRLRPHEKLHPSDARPRRPALPEMQRSRLSSGAVTQASSLFGRAGFHPAMSGLNRESRKAGKQETAGLAYGCVTQR